MIWLTSSWLKFFMVTPAWLVLPSRGSCAGYYLESRQLVAVSLYEASYFLEDRLPFLIVVHEAAVGGSSYAETLERLQDDHAQDRVQLSSNGLVDRLDYFLI
jgi:hypothetical protein